MNKRTVVIIISVSFIMLIALSIIIDNKVLHRNSNGNTTDIDSFQKSNSSEIESGESPGCSLFFVRENTERNNRELQLTLKSITDWKTLVRKLKERTTEGEKVVWKSLSRAVREKIGKWNPDLPVDMLTKELLLADFNRIINAAAPFTSDEKSVKDGFFYLTYYYANNSQNYRIYNRMAIESVLSPNIVHSKAYSTVALAKIVDGEIKIIRELDISKSDFLENFVCYLDPHGDLCYLEKGKKGDVSELYLKKISVVTGKEKSSALILKHDDSIRLNFASVSPDLKYLVFLEMKQNSSNIFVFNLENEMNGREKRIYYEPDRSDGITIYYPEVNKNYNSPDFKALNRSYTGNLIVSFRISPDSCYMGFINKRELNINSPPFTYIKGINVIKLSGNTLLKDILRSLSEDERKMPNKCGWKQKLKCEVQEPGKVLQTGLDKMTKQKEPYIENDSDFSDELAWSPDGTKMLCFTSDEIDVISFADGKIERIRGFKNICEVSWTNEGILIIEEGDYFMRLGKDRKIKREKLPVADRIGKNDSSLLNYRKIDRKISPDGKSVLYVISTNKVLEELFVYELDNQKIIKCNLENNSGTKLVDDSCGWINKNGITYIIQGYPNCRQVQSLYDFVKLVP